MLAIYAHNFPIFQPILMKLVSKFMVHRALSDKTLLSPLSLPSLNCVWNCYGKPCLIYI